MTENIPKTFKAFRIHNDDTGYRSGVDEVGLDDLTQGDVTIRVEWSSINYKDALAATGKGRILRKYPLTGGIDVAGRVIESADERFEPGQAVVATGCQLSEEYDGGYAEFLRLRREAVVALPDGLSTREAMALGTAGFTAALCLQRMEDNGQKPDKGPIVVTGASGGVGTIAINLLTHAGYEVHAITGKVDHFDWLEHLGARQCISRHDLHWGQNPLEKTRWAGCIDNVGGEMLAGISRVIDLWGNIASCGMAGGIGLTTTVFPFILRGVSLLGISSNNTPYEVRTRLWERLAGDWKPPQLDEICRQEVSLEDMKPVFKNMLSGGSLGRTVVKVGGYA